MTPVATYSTMRNFGLSSGHRSFLWSVRGSARTVPCGELSGGAAEVPRVVGSGFGAPGEVGWTGEVGWIAGGGLTGAVVGGLTVAVVAGPAGVVVGGLVGAGLVGVASAGLEGGCAAPVEAIASTKAAATIDSARMDAGLRCPGGLLVTRASGYPRSVRPDRRLPIQATGPGGRMCAKTQKRAGDRVTPRKGRHRYPPVDRRLSRALLAAAALAAACTPAERRFPLREPMWNDTDLQPVYVRCRKAPTPDDRHHVVCAPQPYEATILWDGADNLLFRPVSNDLGIVRSGEAVNVNSLDEVPNSSWFTNRLGVRPMTLDELRMNSCKKSQLLDPDHAPDHSWLIDKGKTSGSTPGFRMTVPGKGKYMVKVEATGLPERQVAASVIGEALYYAAGYNSSCEQALLVRPSIFKLKPGLVARDGNFGDFYPFDQKALEALFAKSNHHGPLLRISASAWIPGYVIEQFRYEGTRSDDPNDVVPHEDRRELRGARLLAALIDHFDSREGNSLDSWIPDVPGAPSDSSPGHVVHFQIGTSAALGSVWDWDPVSRRLGYSYVLDWGDMAADIGTFGTRKPVWERVEKVPGHETFGYFDVDHFDPERWKNEYANAAFERMTERDGAWMARILARLTPEMIRTLAEMGQFADPANTDYLTRILSGRLHKILERYLTHVSPIANVHVEGGVRVCGVDLAEWRGLRDRARFLYTARMLGGPWVTVERRPEAEVCALLPHVAPDGGLPDSAPGRYVRIRIEDGVARGPLVAHLYDLGPTRGYFLVGLERPDR